MRKKRRPLTQRVEKELEALANGIATIKKAAKEATGRAKDGYEEALKALLKRRKELRARIRDLKKAGKDIRRGGRRAAVDIRKGFRKARKRLA
jgi:hypothetical protein